MTVDGVIALAEEIMRAPQRGAIGASVVEVAAMAATILDLWDVALAAEVLIGSQTLTEAADIADGITHRLADLRSEPATEAINP